MAAIKKRGYLRLATSGDVLLWGSTDTRTGDPVGYDVDLATEIAKKLKVPIVYKVIPYSQRLSVLNPTPIFFAACCVPYFFFISPRFLSGLTGP